MSDALTPRDTPLREGDPAPDFTLKDQNKNDWTLSAALAKGDVVLCFFPMAFSPVCSNEMKCVTEEMEKWSEKAQVVGISCDSFFALKAWADQLGLKQPLLADMHRRVNKAYGLYWEEMNISKRGTFVITRGEGGRPTVKWAQARDTPQAMNFDEVLAHVG